jgi:hypothetical protein
VRKAGNLSKSLSEKYEGKLPISEKVCAHRVEIIK